MSIFRPSNINRRLVGTASTLTFGQNAGSPGNGGQIGPQKTPYFFKNTCTNLCLGQRYCGGGGANGGIFKVNESFCGKKERCEIAIVDCKGNFICCGPSTTKWFAAPSCTEVYQNWFNTSAAVTCANSVLGCCGWFVPNLSQLQNPGYTCRTYWDFTAGAYYSTTDCSGNIAQCVNFVTGNTTYACKTSGNHVRAFRCTSS
jgi:hypothetical protein